MNEDILQMQLELEVTEELEEIEFEMDEQEELELEVEEGGSVGGVKDYNELINKPKLNGRVIVGDVEEEDPTVPSWAKQEKKPTYTPEEVRAVDRDAAISLSEIDNMFKQVFG